MSKAVLIPECKRDIGGMREEFSLSPTDKKEGTIGLITRILRLDGLSKRTSISESPPNSEPPTTYYGVYIPCEIKKGPDEEALHVYKNQSEALELVRRYKLSRFKAFMNRQDAVSFALRGAEPVDTTDGNDNCVMGEKPYPFKAPSQQEMVALRKAIEAGLTAKVRDRVWDNPRYLVSSGSTPTILQEGSRYNALHVAAKSLNAEICNLVLTTVGNPAFIQTLYGSDADADCCKEFSSILVDRYLNTPDKAINETPLHFAAKFGAEDVVDVLTSFPQCDRTASNKYGEQPKDIICKRMPNATPEMISRITNMLHHRYYVPVLHTEDDSGAPTIGLPYTPAHPPNINGDPLSPRYEIRAFAGPMEAEDAQQFRKKWKSRPRSASGALAPPTFRLCEISKGLESVGRNLAQQMHVGWKEYWPFLDTFTDLRTPEGLALLENYLKAKYESACSLACTDSCFQSQIADDLSLSRISLNISESPIKNTTMSPMSELCVAMKTCTISSDRSKYYNKTDPFRQRLCRRPSGYLKLLANLPNGEATTPVNHSVSQLLCIERTCQVFAKRIADALHFSLTAEPEVAGASLKTEAKNLQHTMFTYMDDERFQNINFALVHSRLAQLVVFKLKQQTNELDDINNLVEFLLKLRCPNDDIFSSDDERKPTGFTAPSRYKMTHVIDSHVRCLASFICEEMSETDVSKGPSVSESECTNIWEKAAKCRCDWKIEVFERNSKKNASFRKNRSILSTSPKGESFVKKLIFDHDIGDGRGRSRRDSAESGEWTRAATASNTPGGDNAPTTLYTIDVASCHVVPAPVEQVSEDESGGSGPASDSDAYETASENASDVDMEDATDLPPAEPFIYGEEPSKMDRLVWEALREISITPQQYPNVYRWRHTVSLYSQQQRNKWPAAAAGAGDGEDSTCNVSALSCASPAVRVRARALAPPLSSTPTRDTSRDHSAKGPSLQDSNWLRVTGPNSPRSALAAKNVSHNVSFGF